MTYRKPQPPPRKYVGWPLGEAPKRPPAPEDKDADLDEAIRRARRSNELWDMFRGGVMVTLVIAAFIGLLWARRAADLEAREDCQQRGGHVERIHATRDGGWVCVGAHE